MSDLETAVVREARDRILTGFPAQLRACLEALGDDEIWSRPNASSNSIGNLILHLCGSTRHLLGRGVGHEMTGPHPGIAGAGRPKRAR